MKLKIAQVIGLNTDQKAAQVISVKRNRENSFFAVIDLTCDDAFTKGRQVLSELADFYFDFEGTPADKLSSSFKEAQNKLNNQEFAILLAAISGKVLYLLSQGAVSAHLKRSDKLSELLNVGAQNQLISGFVEEGDKLLLSTSGLTRFLGDDLNSALNLPTDTLEEEMATRIGSSNTESEGLAALMVEVELENAPETIPSLKEESPDNTQTKTVASVMSLLFTKLVQLTRFFPKSGKVRLLLAMILIMVIVSGIGFKVIGQKRAEKQARLIQLIQGAKDEFSQAKGLASLNPTEAKNKLTSASDKINQALSLDAKYTEALNFKKQIEQESPSILMQSEVADFPLFLDLDLIKKDFKATQMSLSNGKLLALDPAPKTLVLIDVNKKSNQILGGSQNLGEAALSSVNGALAFVYSLDKGLLKVDSLSQKITTVSKKDSEWGEIKDIYGFASNVYVLDGGKNKIWKYLPTPDGYSDKREYLSKNTKAEFSDALRMQIESSIYVLKKDGQILRFTKGDKDNFSYDGLPSGVKDPKSFFVSSDTDNLYVLDSGNSRLLILSKTGKFKGTVTGSKFAQASDLVVDEKEKKVYLLEGSKIFQLDLK